MKATLLLLLLVACTAAHTLEGLRRQTADWEEGRATVDVCKSFFWGTPTGESFSRRQAYECVMLVTDTDGDGRITPAEIDATKERYLSTIEKAISSLMTQAETSWVMHECDYDGDGAITYRDIMNSTTYCLPLRDPYSSAHAETGALCRIMDFCKRAEKELGHPVFERSP